MILYLGFTCEKANFDGKYVLKIIYKVSKLESTAAPYIQIFVYREKTN